MLRGWMRSFVPWRLIVPCWDLFCLCCGAARYMSYRSLMVVFVPWLEEVLSCIWWSAVVASVLIWRYYAALIGGFFFCYWGNVWFCYISSISPVKWNTLWRACALHKGGHFTREICYQASICCYHLPHKVSKIKFGFFGAPREMCQRRVLLW